MKIFMTGASGYVGRAVVSALIRRGHHVMALARSRSAADIVTQLGATAVHGSLTDLTILRIEAARADGVVHLGQHPGPDTAMVDQHAATALLDGLAGHGPYIHTGGTWVYGDTTGVIDEDAPMNPPDLVSWRLDNEKRVLARAEQGEHPVLVMPGIVYGRQSGLIQSFLVEPGRAAGAIPYIEDGLNHWALVHVEDIAELYALALDAPAGASYAGVNDEKPQLVDVARALSQAAGLHGRIASLTIEQARAQMGGIADAFALDQQITAARARRQLGWNPTHRNVLDELRTSS